jgi:hypothetical protein
MCREIAKAIDALAADIRPLLQSLRMLQQAVA